MAWIIIGGIGVIGYMTNHEIGIGTLALIYFLGLFIYEYDQVRRGHY